MGWADPRIQREMVALRNERERAVNAAIAAERERIANKLVMVLTDSIVTEIVRPGPIAEERECYDMAQEIRDHRQVLTEIVLAVLNVEGVAITTPTDAPAAEPIDEQ